MESGLTGVPHAALAQLPLAHLAVAVRELGEAGRLYEALGFTLNPPEIVAAQQIRAVVAEQGALHIELLEPLTAGSGPIGKYLEKRGPGLHHVALYVNNLAESLATLGRQGIGTLPGYPAKGLGGKSVAFLDVKSTGGVLIELIERPGDRVNI